MALTRILFISLVILFSTASVAQNANENTDVSAETPVQVAAAIYPRTVETEQGTVVVHHPQIESWDDFKTLSGWIVIEATLKGSDKTWIGSALLQAKTDIDFDERLVVLHDISVVDRKFPDGEPPENILQMVRDAISLQPRSVVLDVLIRALPEDFKVAGADQVPEGFSFKPPKIFASQSPAALMIIDGEPVKVGIQDTSLEYVVNTNWDLFWDTKKSRWYVLNEKTWQRSDVLLGDEWKTTKRLPRDFKKLPEEKNWDSVRRALPAKKPDKEPPRILTSKEPAELILLKGAPQTVPIADTGIDWVTNTESELFVHGGNYYYLVSGRWFSAASLESDWAAVDSLPEAFADIPAGHKKDYVLVSVPGTEEARVALIEARIPRTAKIDVNAGSDLKVYYAGEPQFVPVEGTTLQRAANTSNQVFAYGGLYYLCYNAAWFSSTSPEGPWQLATSVPDEIYKIPPSDPGYNVTYVYVVAEEEPVQMVGSTTVSTHVTYAYTSGYYGVYPYYSVVYGTGWYYNPWVYYPPYGYPYYGYYPHSYGYGAWYNPVNGTYGQRAAVYGPYGGAATTAVYNPQTGSYARGWSAWDNNELARSGYGYNPRSNTLAAGNMYYDYDSNSGWREGYVQRGDNWVYGDTQIDGNTRTTNFETGRGLEGTSRREVNDGVMTGSGTISGNGRSAQTQSRIDDQGAQLSIDGSGGGNVDISQDRGSTSRDISGTTASGTAFEGQSERTAGGGRQTELSSEAGGQLNLSRNDGNISGIGQDAGGNVYAGRNGNIYKKGDDGWSQYDNGHWSNVDRNASRSDDVTRDSLSGDRNASRSGDLTRDSLSADRNASRSGDLTRDSLSANRSSQFQRDSSNLNRQRNARESGYRNHSQYRSQAGSRSRSGGMNRGRARGGRRR